jgi:hypothetical protein
MKQHPPLCTYLLTKKPEKTMRGSKNICEGQARCWLKVGDKPDGCGYWHPSAAALSVLSGACACSCNSLA